MKTLMTSVFLTMATTLVASADWHPLWPGGAPGGAKPAGVTEKSMDGGRLTDTESPQYQVFLPDEKIRTGAAVVIFPGGGYTVLAAAHEGRDYAEWLNQRGVVAVLVKYRVSGDDKAGFRFPVPLLDARRAIRVTRSKAKDWGVDPAKVGVMGSSAGGHLASMGATLWGEKFDEEGGDEIDRLDCRPDFSILVYPVITMTEKWGHGGSKRRLLGPSPDAALAERVSTERRVDAKTPPCFLVHAADDTAVPLRNSLEFAARCAEHKVPVVCHVFAQGGHGFGLKGRGDSENWPARLEEWLASRNLTKRPWVGDADE